MNSTDPSEIEARVRAECARKKVRLSEVTLETVQFNCRGRLLIIPGQDSSHRDACWPFALALINAIPTEPTVEEKRLAEINAELQRLGYDPIHRGELQEVRTPSGNARYVGGVVIEDPCFFAADMTFLRSIPTPEPKEEPEPEQRRPRKTKIADWTAPIAEPDPETLYLRLIRHGSDECGYILAMQLGEI